MFNPKQIKYFILEKEIVTPGYVNQITVDVPVPIYTNDGTQGWGTQEQTNGLFIAPQYSETLVPYSYPVYSQVELDEWLPVIQSAYGQYGDVTVTEENVPQKSLTAEEHVIELQKANVQLEAGMAQIAMEVAKNTLLQGGNL